MAKEEPARSKYLTKAEEEAARICSARSAGSPGGTCWNGEGTIRRKQPWFMGEGSGFDLICFGPDKTTRFSRGTTPGKPEVLPRKKRKPKKLRPPRPTKEQVEAQLARVRAKRAAEGRTMTGFRVYSIQWPKKKWWERAMNAGGVPEGVDVAHTEFGDLIIVPVNEVLELSKQMEAGIAEVPDEPMVDREGRAFWVPLERMELIGRIFGSIRWRQPLLLAEVEQFGVKLAL